MAQEVDVVENFGDADNYFEREVLGLVDDIQFSAEEAAYEREELFEPAVSPVSFGRAEIP